MSFFTTIFTIINMSINTGIYITKFMFDSTIKIVSNIPTFTRKSVQTTKNTIDKVKHTHKKYPAIAPIMIGMLLTLSIQYISNRFIKRKNNYNKILNMIEEQRSEFEKEKDILLKELEESKDEDENTRIIGEIQKLQDSITHIDNVSFELKMAIVKSEDEN